MVPWYDAEPAIALALISFCKRYKNNTVIKSSFNQISLKKTHLTLSLTLLCSSSWHDICWILWHQYLISWKHSGVRFFCLALTSKTSVLLGQWAITKSEFYNWVAITTLLKRHLVSRAEFAARFIKSVWLFCGHWFGVNVEVPHP